MNVDDLQRWLQERLPADLCAAPPAVTRYDDEVLITLSPVVAAEECGDRGAERAAILRLREETRPLRMRLARELQRAIGLPVAWGMRLGGSEMLFTSRSVPVMTRLGRAEREVLDTLVAVGLADTRSAALAYVVRAFAEEHHEWLAEARRALAEVEKVRARLKLTPRKGPPAES
ncbi:MAG: hypothetical protein DIU80_021960 [Chloroflexota bacterium]|jgi:hypothetical protein|nr:MAG: hypothetical protein DIU80_19750 [Chloroflexota bacterium]